MPKRDWVRDAPIIGLIGLAILALGFFMGRIESVDRPSKNERACAEGNYAYCDTTPKTFDPLSGEYRPADPYEKSNRDEYRDERDLIAQKDMATWASLMFFATAAGVILIFFTLQETVKAAKFAARTLKEAEDATMAAIATIAVTREVGEAQARAYLIVKSVRISFRPEPKTIKIRIAFANGGNTPAQQVAVQIGHRAGGFEEMVGYDPWADAVARLGMRLRGWDQGPLRPQRGGAIRTQGWSGESAPFYAEDGIIKVWGVLRWRDIFHRRLAYRFGYSCTTPLSPRFIKMGVDSVMPNEFVRALDIERYFGPDFENEDEQEGE
ncbi:MAG: hypothetical protein ABL957_03845 [Parvularculaceae bacterium]